MAAAAVVVVVVVLYRHTVTELRIMQTFQVYDDDDDNTVDPSQLPKKWDIGKKNTFNFKQ